jgi:catechol 2,3-dioxygenase
MPHQSWPLRHVTLKVLDLTAQISFYRDFGFRTLDESPAQAVLAAGDGFLLNFQQLTNGHPRPQRSAGLFHFAILVPTREDLGSFLRHAARYRWEFVGSADHLVSEALYFSDPEGNGIEVYADRPREEWTWQSEKILMDTLPLDTDSLAALGTSHEPFAFPARTRLGHVHLTVSDLDASQLFYESLGLHLTANWGNFRFLAWDNYHHHIAINLLSGPNAKPVSPRFSGLASFSLQRDTVASILQDPSSITIVPPSS